MKEQRFSFKDFQFSSKIIRDFVEESAKVVPFTGSFYSEENILKQTEQKTFSKEERTRLVAALKAQYLQTPISNKTAENIQALESEHTYTITTGHQLNLVTGPLYTLYKILQVITICEKLNKREEQYFVPVFWMATEDHDFEEINHLHLFNEKIAWEKEGQEDHITGAIETHSMTDFFDQIRSKFKDEAAREKLETLLGFYQSSANLAAATRELFNYLFGNHGLVILDGNDPLLKEAFQPIARKEIEQQLVYDQVSKTNHELGEAGYHQQVYLRHCNLFYINDANKRIRIGLEDGQFKLGDSPIEKAELLKQLEEHPASFSPNALLRPVYQELVLPNVAYIGGGGEIAYWMQLKGVFDSLEVPFPILRVRDSFIILNDRQLEDMSELGLTIKDLKRDYHDLLKEIALNEVQIEIELDVEKSALKEIEAQLSDKVEHINKGLLSMVGAEFTKMEKSLERIESKMIKAEKSRHDQKGKKIERLQQKIYPNGGFQERYENLLMYFFREEEFLVKLHQIMLETEDKPYIHIIKL